MINEHKRLTLRRLALVMSALVISHGASRCLAQDIRPSNRPHIHLPRSYGATPLSTVLHANAVLTAARGDFLESQANARVTHAIAAEKEMKNSVEWVLTYFRRKEINRQYTKRPSFIERERERNAETWTRIDQDYHVQLDTDPTDDLNFMLRELHVLAPSAWFYEGVSDSLVRSEFDEELSAEEIHHVWLTDGAGVQFRADDTALKVDWPHVLRAESLDFPRKQFESARNAAASELASTGQLSYATAELLKEKLNLLAEAFKLKYPRKQRTVSVNRFSEYLAGEKCLQSFAVNIHRMIVTGDPLAFDGSLQFQGGTVANLVSHMHMLGLRFAPRQPGGEGVYQKLFIAMRHFNQTFREGT